MASPLYGTETRRALNSFPPCGRRLSDVPEFVTAYAHIKAAAALANHELGTLEAPIAEAIVTAADRICTGEHLEQFPIPLVQGGSGTSTNMNVNEVIASLATAVLGGGVGARNVHPIDHVNRSQSSNDTYPTAIGLTLLSAGERSLVSLGEVVTSLERVGDGHGDRVRLGRTCLQDAVPISIRDTHYAQAAGMRRVGDGLKIALMALETIPLGGTAIGTGIGAPKGFSDLTTEHLSKRIGRELISADRPMDVIRHLDRYAEIGAACARAGMLLGQIAGDLRFWGSGPKGGINELELPALQLGSSIMPGKVNPVIPELVIQLSFRIRGVAETVDLAVAAGELELNVMGPVVFDGLLTALQDISNAASALWTRCLDGMRWREAAVNHNLVGSLEQLVERACTHGYEASTGGLYPTA